MTKAVARLAQISIDTESNRRQRYEERVCLIQLGTPRKVYLIDPLSIRDMSPLGNVLLDTRIQKVFHEARYDLEWIHRDMDLRVKNVFDTAVAARLVGMNRIGLDSLLMDLLGVEIEKTGRLQKQDWGIRPLPLESIRYAATDVWHLGKLRDILYRKGQELGRDQWMQEEFTWLESIQYRPPDPEATILRIKGAGGLTNGQRGLLKDLWRLREQEARRVDRPSYMVMPDRALVYISSNPYAKLDQFPGLGPMWARRLGTALNQLRETSLNGDGPTATLPMPESTTEEGGPTADQKARWAMEKDRLKALRRWRAEVAERLGIRSELVWDGHSLERLARDSNNIDAELNSENIRQWQRDEFGDSLVKALRSLE